MDKLIIERVDMRSTLGQELDYYEKRSYKPNYAIAEFVDNSVASYLLNKPMLTFVDPNYQLKVDILYNQNEKTLEIIDNAGGMSAETFKNALILGKKPESNSGLNEFGYGLKTSASWFGKIWSVRSTAFSDVEEFFSEININELLRSGENEVPISMKNVDPNLHYTIVKISSLIKNITDKQIEKLKSQVSSMYRRFLTNNEIQITFNGTKLTWTEPEILTIFEDGKEKVWKKEFSEEIHFNKKVYHFSGFIGLLKIGSYKDAGFTLLRRNRVIVGGYENGYKPTEIFGAANSFQSFRLFGEINMDDFPVTQAKDNFDWDLDGLEEEFINKLYVIAKDYIKEASEYRVYDKPKPITKQKAQEIADETVYNIKKISPTFDIKIKDETLPIRVETNENGIQIPSVTYTITISGQPYQIIVKYICDVHSDLVTVKHDSNNNKLITIDFNTFFPLFDDIKNPNSAFIKDMQKFFVAYVLAQELTLKTASNHEAVSILNYLFDNLNRILIEMSKEGKFNDE